MKRPDAADRPSTSARASGAGRTPSFSGLSRVEPLGRGSMGTVFRAWQEDLARPVAVKVLHADLATDSALREQFAREAHILARLDHPNIVPVHLAGESESGPYYVMRLVDGASVEHHLAERDPFEVSEVFRAIAQALTAAHDAGVLHRDVKPENILVEANGKPVLVDFGLSARVRPGAAVGVGEGLVGTLDYLAPEVLAGEGATALSDVYALGVTLYVVLTGQVPFPAEDLAEKLRSIRTGDPPLPRSLRSDVPKPLQAICLKAMERSAADRYGSAEELTRDLERFAKGDLVRASPVRSRTLLLRKIELHLADHGEWAEQGLIEDHQRASLQWAYEHLDERERGLLRGVLGSLPNLLLLVGILLTVFGPVLLQVMTWSEQGTLLRLGLPSVPLALLAFLGVQRWRAADRRRAVACLFGAGLLCAPLAFALADLAPPLREIADHQGELHPILPGAFWLPEPDAAPWVRAGARLLEWKLLVTALASLLGAAFLFRRTSSAAFLWIASLAGLGAITCGALLVGWEALSPAARWPVALAMSFGTLALGLAFDKRFRRDRAQPFYSLGFVMLLFSAINYSSQGVPAVFLGIETEFDSNDWSGILHGLSFVAAGVAMDRWGSPLQRSWVGLPLLVGLLMTLVNLGALATRHGTGFEILLVTACVGFLVLGLMLHRNTLVLPAALALPICVGAVSQQHVSAIWAWAGAVVLSGAIMLLLSIRLVTRAGGRLARPASAPGPTHEVPAHHED